MASAHMYSQLSLCLVERDDAHRRRLRRDEFPDTDATQYDVSFLIMKYQVYSERCTAIYRRKKLLTWNILTFP
jgi:hypothetical protein